MIQKNKTGDDEWIELREREPGFMQAMEEALDEVTEPPELEEKVMAILHKHKMKSEGISENKG
jgi:hypothetical protein